MANVYAQQLRMFAKALDSAGDMIGSNNFVLSGRLWAVCAELKEYAKEVEENGRIAKP